MPFKYTTSGLHTYEVGVLTIACILEVQKPHTTSATLSANPKYFVAFRSFRTRFRNNILKHGRTASFQLASCNSWQSPPGTASLKNLKSSHTPIKCSCMYLTRIMWWTEISSCILQNSSFKAYFVMNDDDDDDAIHRVLSNGTCYLIQKS